MLEDIAGDEQLDWVRKHNDPTIAEFSGELFEQLRSEALEVLDTDARIPYVRRRGEYLYNFWRDATNPRGLWRRTTLESYLSEDPEWDVIIDVDALAAADGEKWVWAGADVIEPDLTRALVSLSPGGSDAAIVREFDMLAREFVVDGFELPEAKSRVSWEDVDTLLVGTDFGPDSMTESGYPPRMVKRWRRGQPLADAETVFTGPVTDVAVGGASVDRTPGYERTHVSRAVDFFNDEVYELRSGELIRIDAPTDAGLTIHREWLLIELRSDWETGTASYRTGSLLAAKYDEFLAGTAELAVVFEPDERSSLHQYSWTLDRLLLVTLVDVASRVEIVTPGSWSREPVAGVEGNTVIVATDDVGDEIFLDSSDFITPSRLLYGKAGAELTEIKRAPSFFLTPRTWRCPSISPPPMTARRSPPTSSSATSTIRRRARRCWADTADSRCLALRVTTECWVGCGCREAVRTCSRTSVAAASTDRAGTRRRCARVGTRWPRTSPRWQAISSPAGSPRSRSWVRRAAATAAC